MKLRLLLTERCNRNCPGCCNKDYDLNKLPIELDFRTLEEKEYELIMITGGEPLVVPDALYKAVGQIRKRTTSPIIVYTAKVDDIRITNWILDIVDGLTVTLHNQDDVMSFLKFAVFMNHYKQPKSLRLNVFEGVELPPFKYEKMWQVKRDLVWKEHCPIPDDEVFHQYSSIMLCEGR